MHTPSPPFHNQLRSGQNRLEDYFDQPQAPESYAPPLDLDWQIQRARKVGQAFRRQENGDLGRLLWWVFHPSEHVVLNFLRESFDGGLCRSQKEGQVRLGGYWRGMAALDTGEVWNPVLDQLAHQQAWPATQHGAIFRQLNGAKQVLEVAGQLGWEQPIANARIQPPHVQIEKLVPWIRQQNDHGRLLDLLEFDYIEIGKLVAEQTVRADEEMVEHLLGKSAEIIGALAYNEHLTPPAAQKLRTWAAHQSSPSVLLEGGQQIPGWADALEGLGHKGWDMPVKLENDLLRLHQHLDFEDIEGSLADWMLAGLAGLSAELLQTVYDLIPADRLEAREDLLKAESAGPELWVHALRGLETPSPQVAFYLLKQEEVESNPRLRQTLLDCQDARVLNSLFPRLKTPQERRYCFQQLSTLQAHSALELVDEYPKLQQQLQRQDLSALLQDSRPEVRTRTLRLLSTLPEEEPSSG